MSKIITTHHQLFGPVQVHYWKVPLINHAFALGGAHIQNNTGGQYVHIGQALSSGQKRFNLANAPRVRLAELNVVWLPQDGRDCLVLYKCDTGPSNLKEICRIHPPYSFGEDRYETLGQPNNQKTFFTDAFNQMVDAQEDKQLLLKIGVHGKPVKLYEAEIRLEHEI